MDSDCTEPTSAEVSKALRQAQGNEAEAERFLVEAGHTPEEAREALEARKALRAMADEIAKAMKAQDEAIAKAMKAQAEAMKAQAEALAEIAKPELFAKVLRRLEPARHAWAEAARWTHEAGPAVAAVVAVVLEGEGGAASPLAAPLAGRLARHLVDLRHAAGLDTDTPPETLDPPEREDMLAPTARAVAYLVDELQGKDEADELKEAGLRRWADWTRARDLFALAQADPEACARDIERVAELAELAELKPEARVEWAEAARDRAASALWRPWLAKREGDLPPVAAFLAAALLPGVRAEAEAERKRAEAERARRTELISPALTFAVRRRFAELGNSPPGQLTLPRDPEGLAWFIAPSLPGDLVRSVRRGLAEIDGVAGDRLLRFLVCEVWERYCAGEQDPRLLLAPGLVAMAVKVGLAEEGAGRKGATTLRALLDAMQHTHARWPGGEFHGLLTWGHDRHAPRKAPLAWVNVDPMLAPYAWRHIDDPDMRRLIPVLRDPPPLGSVNPKIRPAALAMSWQIVELCVENVQIMLDRGVALDWRRLAKEANFPETSLDTLREAWIGTFLLARGDRFALADENARKLLEQSAEGRERHRAQAIARKARKARQKP